MVFFQAANLRVEKTSEHAATLLFDVAGHSLNVFNRHVLADLDAALDAIDAETILQVLTIRSVRLTKPFAGGDLRELASVRSSSEAVALSEMGQRVYAKLAKLRLATIIVISGPCLGGGLEMALACDYRLVIDHPKTQFGMPEVDFGLLPGWGGTQRLPRLIGLERALRIILGGRRLSAKEAQDWRLADMVVPANQDFAAPLRELEMRSLQEGKRSRNRLPRYTWRQRLLESNRLGQALLFRGTERILRRHVPDDMPAPAEAWRVVRTGLTHGLDAGLAAERDAVGRLAATSACHNLINLFLLRERARTLPATAREQATIIRRIGVVGVGTMGSGIAYLMALKGYEVIIQEVNPDTLGSGLLAMAVLFQKAIDHGFLSSDDAYRRLANVRATTHWEGFDQVDLVIEAITEDLAAKQKIFHELEDVTGPATILTTNTASLSIQRLQEGLKHPERVAGLHFFNPAHKIPLIEIVKTQFTHDCTLATLTTWAVALGKTPVSVQDSSGFIVDRIMIPYLHEAVLLLAEGMSIDHIDQAMRRFGMPLGPLELLDQIGLDVAVSIARATPSVQNTRSTELLGQMADSGWLGRKRRLGFYRYQEKHKTPRTAVHELSRKFAEPSVSHLLQALPLVDQMDEARERMVMRMVNEAAFCLGEGLAADAGTIDLAMVIGAGWSPHRGGPLRYTDQRGLDNVVRQLADLAQRWGSRFSSCQELQRRTLACENFYPKAEIWIN